MAPRPIHHCHLHSQFTPSLLHPVYHLPGPRSSQSLLSPGLNSCIYYMGIIILHKKLRKLNGILDIPHPVLFFLLMLYNISPMFGFAFLCATVYFLPN